LKIVSFVRPGSDEPRVGALLEPDLLLDFAHEATGVPEPRRFLDWFDLEQSSLEEARTLHEGLATGREGHERLRRAGAILARSSVRLLAPVPRPGKILCIGLNYADHAKEGGHEIPSRPLVFSKFASSVIAPGDEVRIPRGCEKLDYEAELGVVIGRRAKLVPEERGLEHVLGYVNFNDVSARDFQFADGQWQRGKSCDTFAPFGPCLVTTDELPDPQRLAIRLRVNGETRQDSSTAQMIFGVAKLVMYLSEAFTLEPGDVIATGTPPGVGFARKPPLWLHAGDRVEVEVEGLGVLANPVAR
jgi:2-keto-4-pentenoate hydratase/2-oxohepta-3-ene-1,7-dioic acid hydratase in catechol pathway